MRECTDPTIGPLAPGTRRFDHAILSKLGGEQQERHSHDCLLSAGKLISELSLRVPRYLVLLIHLHEQTSQF